jgi:hypothetical protein
MSNHKPPEIRAYESPYWGGNYNSGNQSIANSVKNVRRSRQIQSNVHSSVCSEGLNLTDSI